MARMHVMEQSETQAIMSSMHEMLEKRLSVSSLAPCPVEFTASYVAMCATQSCGKCTPCRNGLRMLRHLFNDVLNNRATLETLDLIESTARTVYLSSDCAIGYEAGEVALMAIRGFRDDFEHHVTKHACGFSQHQTVPCVSGCPAGVDIPGYIALVEAGRYTEAVRLIRKDNPLPLVCGLVCEHPCEMHCRRGMVDDPMNIRGLKRYAVDHAGDYRPLIKPATGKRVAVVGGGPAGISCAYYLTLMGHKVKIFEQRAHLGGMLRYGIPNYRLPREQLDSEIQWILDCGIDVELDHSVDGDEMNRLRSEYDAVYLAIGAHADKKLGLPGEDAEGVMSAVQLLRDMGDNNPPDFKGLTVAVVGGGNVAMDVARTSVRLGAEKVIIAYRRRVADMTAQDEEIAGAEAEGCEVMDLHAPKEVVVEDGRVVGLKVEPQIIGGLKRGRPAPRAAEGGDVVVPCDRVVVAIGQDIDSATFEEQGVPCKWGRIITDPDGAVPGQDGLFSGGDCQSGPATVIRAINAGKVAAGNIDNYLLQLQDRARRGAAARAVQGQDLLRALRDARARGGRAHQRLRHRRERPHRRGGASGGVPLPALRPLRFGAFRGGRIEQW